MAAGLQLRKGLVVLQMALAVVLTLGAGLLIESFSRLMSVEPGFDLERVLTLEVELAPARYPTAVQTVPFYRQLFEGISTLPGVERLGGAWNLPLAGRGGTADLVFDHRPAEGAGEKNPILTQAASADYFRTLGIPLHSGRAFTEADREDAPGVVVINRAAVDRYFPDEDPIGKRVTFFVDFGPVGQLAQDSREIVGVVGNVPQHGLDQPVEPEMFFPLQQAAWRRVTLAVRTQGDPMALARSVRAQVQEVDPELAVAGVRTLEDVVAGSVLQPRAWMWLMTLFAAVAVVLAAVGIYGITAYAVSRRTREMGIRMALGAQRAELVRLILRESLTLSLVGLVLGVVLAVALTRVLSGFLGELLYGVQATDLPILLTVGLVLAAVAVLAGLVPARRTTRIDPALALRR